DAAAAVGCDVAQIVKSLVFLADGRPVVALVSGANRLDPPRLATALGARSVERADGNAVRAATGYAIGGVPPVGHATRLPVFIDRDLMAHARIYGAAGTPNAVFPVSPADLVRVTAGQLADLAAD
ncbi:MAG TPA: YbaK/EbsC family protein, partial [Methylomirabilota bacterium]|nr:YbaK/EbsC family protein [Methylomirabilota bacterium]